MTTKRPGTPDRPAGPSAPERGLPTPSLSITTPRKRRRSEAHSEDSFTQRGPFDRFIATGVSPHATPQLRGALRHNYTAETPTRQTAPGLPTPSSSTSTYADALGVGGDGRLLHYGPPSSATRLRPPPTEEEVTRERLNRTPTRQGDRAFAHTTVSHQAARRIVPRSPERVLDAPGLRNDYYIDVLDWSFNNLLAVGLGNKVYLWDEKTAGIHELWAVDEPDYITSCKFSPDGLRIAVGSETGRCEMFSVPKVQFRESRCKARIRHRNGLAALAWTRQHNNLYLTTGDKHGVIRVYNTTAHRASTTGASSTTLNRTHCELVKEWSGVHKDRIVGLKWSHDGRTLASGGNDNLVCFWQLDRAQNPRHIIRDHTSAVRALDWCPWDPELLATGGGLEDRKIRVYNSRGEKRMEIETGSQVCTVHWSKGYRELISTHHTLGDQLIIWAWPGMKEIGRLPGHQQRPLFLAMNATGEMIVTGSGDENLKFWKCFPLQDGQRPLMPRGSDLEEHRRLAADVR
ncbi:hypothetical protein PhCBS80983_g02711 [Powellomyces hirtus]|uniref:CDC20/Fizzy WD40 domain-containing protein n=1 Tax=Powellomyces hirtus TaxID=109895 RepID=A0A507E4U6_9FUNG|nr:hypothetical protein PhCBS80983_g02711 [Powellomyces hirtus]